MAEGAGFEPAVGVNLRTLSKRVPSTTQPPLRRRGVWRTRPLQARFSAMGALPSCCRIGRTFQSPHGRVRHAQRLLQPLPGTHRVPRGLRGIRSGLPALWSAHTAETGSRRAARRARASLDGQYGRARACHRQTPRHERRPLYRPPARAGYPRPFRAGTGSGDAD